MGHPILKAAAVTAAAGAACFSWGLFEAGLYTLRRAEVRVLRPGARELKLLHISDVHLLHTQRRKLAFLSSLASLEPDLVVNTGDNLTEAAAVEPLLEALAPLSFAPGAFVFGSNDYYPPSFRNPVKYVSRRPRTVRHPRVELPWRELKSGLESFGWVDLDNRRAQLDVGGLHLDLRGTDDAHLNRDEYEQVAGPFDPAADLKLGVTHAPYLRVLDQLTADDPDLILAGHTHGGQVCVPGYGALATNCDIEPARVKGLSEHTVGPHTSALHVSAGLGTSRYAPYRFACRPEVTMLTLQPRL
ncbi:metallophosphoesterase [Tessaracoccus palaemonis]|uniref:Metallophosphoesterase n=1 Tax=Tessaracoccus palaemonis TaxID=2829499 RepID=A0ABX8SGN6_9ACTN|nr:metallophosphoesterase [Tessaracoccus palaemonis]QXT62471.1 metallophosphoesterase [Tessaracoccus palaemonis]